MSRSYKKTPKLKYCGWGKKGKRWANKAIRKQKTLWSEKSNGYRKLYQSWNITDVRKYWSRPKTEQSEELEMWEKYYRRK